MKSASLFTASTLVEENVHDLFHLECIQNNFWSFLHIFCIKSLPSAYKASSQRTHWTANPSGLSEGKHPWVGKQSQATGFPTVPKPWLDHGVSDSKYFRVNGAGSQRNRGLKQRMWLKSQEWWFQATVQASGAERFLTAHKIVIGSQKVLLYWKR